MPTVGEIYHYIDSFAPFATQMDFDNAGLLVGDRDSEVKRILVALDVTLPVIQEAIRQHCDLIVTHHPVIFHPVRALTAQDPVSVKLMSLTKKNIAVISAHTNLDLADGGVNDVLAARLGLHVEGILEPMGTYPGDGGKPYGLGRIGSLTEAVAPSAFGEMVKKALTARGVRMVLGDRPVKRVAVCGGSGGDLISLAAEWGCDALVTGDVKYDQFLEADQRGITLVDGGHFATEDPVVEVLAEKLRKEFDRRGVDVLVSKRHHEVYFSV